jgi:hypothetical protein
LGNSARKIDISDRGQLGLLDNSAHIKDTSNRGHPGPLDNSACWTKKKTKNPDKQKSNKPKTKTKQTKKKIQQRNIDVQKQNKLYRDSQLENIKETEAFFILGPERLLYL